MKQPKYIVGNWKQHGSLRENASRLQMLLAGYEKSEALMVCVPFPYLAQAQQLLQGSLISWGAQNVSEHQAGAFTGEVSAAMLADLGCRSVIIGHSERRSLYGEDDDVVARKTVAAVSVGLNPIVCVGETLAQREQGETATVVTRQLEAVLDVLSPGGGEHLMVAYEPVWAIGSGQAASPGDIGAVHHLLRERLTMAGVPGARLLYGGSVRPENAATLLNVPDVDGALVGGASLDAETFLMIAKAVQAI